MSSDHFDPAAFARRRWQIFAGLSLIYILVYFYRVSMAVVAGDLSRDLNLSPQALGTLSGIMLYVYAAAQIPLGPLIDRFGGRIVVSICGLLATAGGFLFSSATSFETALLARILIGLGTSSVLMSTFAIFSHWYTRQEFGRISSLMIAVGNFGNLGGTAPLALAVAAIGWRTSFTVIAVIQALATLLVFTTVRNRPLVAISSETENSAPAPEGLLAVWKEILSDRDFQLLAFLAFFWYGNYLAVQGLWGGPYLMDVLHLGRAVTGKTLMFVSIGFIVGSAISDWTVRKIFGTHKRAFIAGQTVLVLLMSAFLGWAELLPPLLLDLIFFLLGLAVSSGVMIYPIIRSLFPVRIVGTALTSLNFFVLLGAAVNQQAMGWIIGLRTVPGATPDPSAFHAAFLLPIAGLIVAILAFCCSRDRSTPPA